MDMWFHFLVGIFIQMLFLTYFPSVWYIWTLIFLAAFLSHFIVDWGSYLTFHPDETYWDRNPNDKFFLFRTIFSIAITIFVIIYFTRYTEQNYSWVMFLAWAVDVVDWLIIRNLIKIGLIDKKHNSDGLFHKMINKFREKYAWWLPNFRERKKAYIMDFILAIPVIIGIILLY